MPFSQTIVLFQVSEGSFVRAMDVSGIDLTKEDLGLLINRYRAPGGGGLIDYQKFCDQSNKVRNTTTTTTTTPGRSHRPVSHMMYSWAERTPFLSLVVC